MPESTEQILHADKYTAGEAPIAVTLPDDLATRLGPGWTVPLQDTFGEFQLGIWLRESGRDQRRRARPRRPAGVAIAWPSWRAPTAPGASCIDTAWDTEKDATEFADAANAAVEGLPDKGHVCRVDRRSASRS